jgi:hypothetical protein
MSILGGRAGDIIFSNDNDFIEAIGYLASPRHVAFFEAEVPNDGRVIAFENQFPMQSCRQITQGVTSGGNPMKYGVQYRIYLKSMKNCPQTLKSCLGAGRNNNVARINKSAFVEKLVENYGFKFGYRVVQNSTDIRAIVSRKYPLCLADFDRGYNL